MSDAVAIQKAHTEFVRCLMEVFKARLNELELRYDSSRRRGAVDSFVSATQELFEEIKRVFPDKADHRGLTLVWPHMLEHPYMAPFELANMVNDIEDFLRECWASSVYA